MKQPIVYEGTYPSKWAGYIFKESLGTGKGKHTGVDYNHGTDDLGDPIFAITGGKVVSKKTNGQVSGFGNAIIIESICPPTVKGTKLYHRYLHMNTIEVAVGQTVTEGQRIGTVGTSGNVPAHLHLDTWTDRNGLGVHWNYDKYTQLLSYEDPFLLIENNKNWTQGEAPMTATEEANAYRIVLNRPMEHAGSGRTGYEFIVSADSELKAQRKANEAVIATLVKERDDARKLAGVLTSEKLKLEDQLRISKLETASVQAELKETISVYDSKIAELGKAIEIKENEIKRLSNELNSCQNSSGDIEDLTGIQLLIIAIKKLLGKE